MCLFNTISKVVNRFSALGKYLKESVINNIKKILVQHEKIIDSVTSIGLLSHLELFCRTQETALFFYPIFLYILVNLHQ